MCASVVVQDIASRMQRKSGVLPPAPPCRAVGWPPDSPCIFPSVPVHAATVSLLGMFHHSTHAECVVTQGVVVAVIKGPSTPIKGCCI